MVIYSRASCAARWTRRLGGSKLASSLVIARLLTYAKRLVLKNCTAVELAGRLWLRKGVLGASTILAGQVGQPRSLARTHEPSVGGCCEGCVAGGAAGAGVDGVGTVEAGMGAVGAGGVCPVGARGESH